MISKREQRTVSGPVHNTLEEHQRTPVHSNPSRKRGLLKTLALRLSADGNHFDNEAFQAQNDHCLSRVLKFPRGSVERASIYHEISHMGKTSAATWPDVPIHETSQMGP